MSAVETADRIEPALLEDAPANITDVVAELSAKAATLGSALHPRTASNLADLVRIMNTYYSNLIEGHHTRPRDIERALSGELDQDKKRRDLQLEAKAHVRVQAEVDKLFADGPTARPNIIGVHSLPPSRVLSRRSGVHVADQGSGSGVHDGTREMAVLARTRRCRGPASAAIEQPRSGFHEAL
jgi:hypothetical protein